MASAAADLSSKPPSADSGAGILALGPILSLGAIAVAVHFGLQTLSAWLVFEKPDYKAVKESVDKLEAQISKMKADAKTVNEAKRKALLSVVSKTEEDLAKRKQVLQGLGLRAMLFQGFFQLALFIWILPALFGGNALVRLPFEPFSFLTGLTHRGVDGTDMRQGGWVLVFILLNMSLKPLLEALFPPKHSMGAGGGLSDIFAQAQNVADRMAASSDAAAAASSSSKKKN